MTPVVIITGMIHDSPHRRRSGSAVWSPFQLGAAKCLALVP